MSYLILLKNSGDFALWTGEKNEGVVLWPNNDKPQRVVCDNSSQQLQNTTSWIIVAFLEGETKSRRPTGDASEAQKNLKEALNNMRSYKIFHHAGSLNYGDDGYSKVIEKFGGAGFVDAGFSIGNLMNFSEKGSWPWKDKIDPVKKAFIAKLKNGSSGNGSEKDNLSFDQAITLLDEAWDMASIYFKIEKSVEAVRQGLFPLYVDVNSLSPEAQPEDWRAALEGARVGLEQALDAAGLPKESNQILESWRSLQEGLDQELKTFLDAVIALLETSIRVLKGKLDSSSEQDQQLFVTRFRELSNACDCRDKRLKLFDRQKERASGKGGSE